MIFKTQAPEPKPNVKMPTKNKTEPLPKDPQEEGPGCNKVGSKKGDTDALYQGKECPPRKPRGGC